MISGKTAVELAADLAAGAITQKAIEEAYGGGMLATVLGIGGGVIAGIVTSKALQAIDRETGIIGDLGSLVDDVFSIFD